MVEKSMYKCPKCKSPLDYHHEEELTVTFECKRCKCLVLARKPFVGLTVQRKPLTHIPEQTGTLRKTSIDHKKKILENLKKDDWMIIGGPARKGKSLSMTKKLKKLEKEGKKVLIVDKQGTRVHGDDL